MILEKKIKKEVESILLGYSDKCVMSEEHSKNIERLNKFSKENGEELNIGTCQKLLNLLCKYYWCAGWICEPPHATIDRQILAKLPNPNHLKWTEISKMKDYEEIALEAKKVANDKGFSSPAVWELFNWQSEVE